MFIPTWTPVLFHLFLGGYHRRIIPYEIDGPFKQTMMQLFRLAWSSKVQLPLLITVCFMAFDIRLQIEINIFWDQANHRRQEIDDLVEEAANVPLPPDDEDELLDTAEEEESDEEDREEGQDDTKEDHDSDDDDDDDDGDVGQSQSPRNCPPNNQRPDRGGGGGGDADRGHQDRDLSLVLQVELHNGPREEESEVRGNQMQRAPLNILQKFLQSNARDLIQSNFAQEKSYDRWFKTDLRPRFSAENLIEYNRASSQQRPYWVPNNVR